MKGKYQRLSTYETELLALATAIKRWRPYLVGRPFIVKTNYQSLKFLLEQRIAMPAEQKWLAKLLGYAFVVEYKRGLRIGWQMHFPGNLTLLLWTHSCPYNKKQVVCSFSQSLIPHGWLFSRIATLKTLLFSSLFLQFNLVLLPKALPSRMI